MSDDERAVNESDGAGDEAEGHGDDDAGDPLDDRLDDVVNAANDDPDADPFEAIGEGTGPRHGDPFDPFADASQADEGHSGDDHPGDGHPGDGHPGEGDGTEQADPAQDGLPSGVDEDDAEFREAAGEGTDGATGDPFTEFDEPTTDPFGEGETAFDDAATGEIDGDSVWERMDSVDAEAEEVPGKRYVDVNKHSYCETCEYFSEPPEVSCSHEGTEILEFVDMETVRVMDCPIVEERKVLEETE